MYMFRYYGQTRSRKDGPSGVSRNELEKLVLMELGKSLYEQPVSRVTQRVMLNIKSRLTPYDLVLIPKGNTGSEERIKNDIRWARKTLLKHGYLSHYSCHGYWRLTDKGRRYAERLTQRFASEYD